MRKRVVNPPRDFQVGRAANERYLEALAATTDNKDGIRVIAATAGP